MKRRARNKSKKAPVRNEAATTRLSAAKAQTLALKQQHQKQKRSPSNSRSADRLRSKVESEKGARLATKKQQQQQKEDDKCGLDKTSTATKATTTPAIVYKTRPSLPQHQQSVLDEEMAASASVVSPSSSSSLSSSPSCSNSLPIENSSASNMYLLVEMKLISVDVAALNLAGSRSDKQLIRLLDLSQSDDVPNEDNGSGVNFLCVSATATASHLATLVGKMIQQQQQQAYEDPQFDVVLMCNGYEVKPQCPLTFLKNRFFADKDTIKIYYAIVEKKL